jgi:hypothetical protein
MSDVLGVAIAPVAALGPADVFGLVAAFVVCVFLFYALLRGENL